VSYPRALLAACCAACASAGSGINVTPDDAPGGNGGDAPRTHIDAPMQRDAPGVQMDAPASGNMTILSETTNSTLTFGTNCCSVACSVTATGNTHDNIWYRAFQLSDFTQVTGAFHVTSVTFGVQEAGMAGNATVKIGNYSGALDVATLNTAQISQLATASAAVADAAGPPGEKVTVPITADIAAGGKFVVEVSMPDLDPNDTKAAGYFLFIGATKAGETHPGYISSTACSVNAPEKTTTASASAGQILIDVTGTY